MVHGNDKGRSGRLPGDLTRDEIVARMIRVNQAGEYGAKRIYEGQISILEGTNDEPVLRDMAKTEEIHLKQFNKLMVEKRIRPTLLSPLWHVAGFVLGAGTALMGRDAAMACTVAVEEVIEEQYESQLSFLGDGEDEEELVKMIEEIQREEVEHKETAIAEGSEKVFQYPILSNVIKTGSRAAIWLSERI